MGVNAKEFKEEKRRKLMKVFEGYMIGSSELNGSEKSAQKINYSQS